MSNAISRRALLLTGSAAALAAAVSLRPAFSQLPGPDLTTEEFVELSRTLTGATYFDPEMTTSIFGAFLADGKAEALSALADRPADDRFRDLAAAVVSAWYSGVVSTPRGDVVAGYDQALLWNALSFTKPMGSCGGETGYWAEPPAT